jgi:mono/diheme cytochrome c family protein
MNRKQWTGVALALAAGLPLAGRADVDKKIERVWKAKCAACHGADGKAQTDQGQKLGVHDYTKPEWQKGRTDEQIKKAIADGVKGMDGYKDKLAPDQIDGLVAFIRTLK